MSRGFVQIPRGKDLLLSRAKVPATLLTLEAPLRRIDQEGLALVDLEIKDGIIRRISEANNDDVPPGAVDLDGGQVWPAFVDIHTHLDKGHINARVVNRDGTVYGAVEAVAKDRTAHWSADDVRRRFEFGLTCAYAHGVAAIRTHLDSDEPQAGITWPVFAELRVKWAGKIDLQAVGKVPIEYYLTPEGEAFAGLVAEYGGLLGGITRVYGKSAEEAAALTDAAIDALFRLAERHRLDIDLHVDESGDPAANSLGQVAQAAIRRRFPHRVVCGHCCSLAVQPPEVVAPTLDLCAQAKLAVVMLPMINLYLQDRQDGRTPRWRGITLVHEMAARGIPVAVASDNCRDPFFAFGDHDMFEVYAQAVRIAHLDLPYGDWPRAVTATPAELMGLKRRGRLARGVSADLILFRGRTMSELLARPQSDRVVLRAGSPIDTALPDYRELDDLFRPPQPRTIPYEPASLPI
jgi:cytosine deaminase